MHQSRTRSNEVVTAVSGSSVISKVISMPAGLTDDEMEAQIALEADQYIPYPLEEVALDFEVQRPTPGREDQVDVLLAACRRETIDSRGVFRNKETQQTQKVPVLGDLPGVGSLFRSTTNTNKKVETLIFTTPRILSEGLLY